MEVVTIHTYDKQWENAQIVGVGKDTHTGNENVITVRHPHFNGDMDFYAIADEQEKHLNVGNAAFWIIRKER